jgi:Heterokaryon incompatibility protein (HET)
MGVILLIIADSTEDLPLWTSRQLLEPMKRLESAKRWLENCRQNHEQCKTLEASLNRSCPTRLIDVSKQVPRLVCLPTSTKASYATLSHCWGGSLPINSTQKTLGEHMVEIQMAAMPKSYHDAITITRELGIQYLWIDSLCIIQDDAKDWEQEAARMASIYEGAQVTIAAAWGKNGESGCFHDYHPSMVVEVQEQNNFRGQTKGSTIRLYLRPYPNPQRYLGDASLNSRAWTLQEIILSRRTIVFAEDQLYWHCTSLYESEDGLELSDNVAESGLSLPSLGPTLRQPVMPSYKLYESWHNTMQNYSARFLTYSDDKFAALAGITQMFQRIVKDVPLAGLWKNNVCEGLLWQMPPGIHGKLDSEAVRALNIPSWSWIKVRGLVQINPSLTKTCVEISSASVSWTGLPLTSQIINAFITGRGKVIRILDVQRDEDEACMCRAKRFCFETPFNEPPRYHRGYWFIDECTSEIKDPLSCLLICIEDVRDRRKSDPYVTKISALIVAAVQSSHSKHTYRRVGVGDLIEFPRDIYNNSPEVNFTLI